MMDFVPGPSGQGKSLGSVVGKKQHSMKMIVGASLGKVPTCWATFGTLPQHYEGKGLERGGGVVRRRLASPPARTAAGGRLRT